MKILIATEKPFAPVAVEKMNEILVGEGYEVLLLENYKSADELKAAVRDADGLIVRSDIVNADVISSSSNLKIVVRAGAGYDNIDLRACTARGIIVMNTPGQNSNAVAELVFELMLYNARHGFEGRTGTELRGKTFGIHAFGNVGKYVAEISKGFGLITYAFDPYVDDEVIFASGIKVARSAEDLYSKCQYVSLHIPADVNTIWSIGSNLLKRMPSNAVLINCARKEVINEDELKQVFEDRSDFVYLADVAPDCRKELEARYPGRVIFTSKKMGAQTTEANTNAGIAAAHQMVDFIRTGNQRFRVNL